MFPMINYAVQLTLTKLCATCQAYPLSYDECARPMALRHYSAPSLALLFGLRRKNSAGSIQVRFSDRIVIFGAPFHKYPFVAHMNSYCLCHSRTGLTMMRNNVKKQYPLDVVVSHHIFANPSAYKILCKRYFGLDNLIRKDIYTP